MSKFNLLALAVAGVFSLSVAPAVAGSVAGTGGASEVTQLMNNSELLKMGVDQAQQTVVQVDGYLLQIEEYRTQLINTVGIDPATLSPTLKKLDGDYGKLLKYRNKAKDLQGDMNVQRSRWEKRYTEARVSGKSFQDHMKSESELRKQKNAAAIERAARDEEIMNEVNQDIAELKEAEADIPASVGTNESIQKLNRSLNRISLQNLRLTELSAEASKQRQEETVDKSVKDEEAARRQAERAAYRAAQRKRQNEFVNGMQ